MTAVIYARYSSDNQREESIEGQIRECTAYAEKNEMCIRDRTPAVGIGGGAAVNPYKEYPLAEHHRQVLAEMIHRDKNHPCVVPVSYTHLSAALARAVCRFSGVRSSLTR